MHTSVSAEDRRFAELFDRTAEFEAEDPEYPAYRNFNFRAVERGHEVVRLLSEHLPLSGARALDVGAGAGGNSIALAQAGAQVVALEPDPVRLRWAQARADGYGVDVEVRDDTAQRLPFGDGCFDVVVLDNVLEHVRDAEQVIAEIARVLGPGGVAYVAWPNKASLLNVLRDPHHRMLGVVLMPERVARLYVERIRRSSRAYWVTSIPTRRWTIRAFERHGLSMTQIPFEGSEKLRRPHTIRHRAARPVALTATRLQLDGLLARVALAQAPAWRFVARKPAGREAR